MEKRIAIVILVIGVLVIGIWGADILNDRRYKLAIVEPATLYAVGPHEYPESNLPVATVAPGESVRVLKMRYGKDFQTFRLETPHGQVGWVVAGREVRVIAHGE